MVAKLTNNLNLTVAKSFYDQIRDTSNEDRYYAAVAFINDSDYMEYAGQDSDTTEFRGGDGEEFGIDDQIFYSQNTVSMHRILAGGVSRVAKRINWIRNDTYESWSPNATNYYVLVREFVSGIARLNVYKCLYSPGTPSVSPPAGSLNIPFQTSDGYWWLYMYSIDNSQAIRFLTENWIPVPEKVTVEESQTLSTGTTRYFQFIQQQNAIIGSVFDIKIDHADTISWLRNRATYSTTFRHGFSLEIESKDNVNRNDVSRRAKFRITYDSDKQEIDHELLEYGFGHSGLVTFYDPLDPGHIADSEILPTISGISASIAPGIGHAADAPSELFANTVMLVVRNVPDGDLLKVTRNDFRMLNVIKNPIDASTNAIGQRDLYIACKSFDAADTPSFEEDDIISTYPYPSTFTKDDKVGRVVSVDNNRVYYINQREGGEASRFDSDVVQANNTSGPTATITRLHDRQVIFNSGEMILSDWRETKSSRSSDQIESMNFIFTF